MSAPWFTGRVRTTANASLQSRISKVKKLLDEARLGEPQDSEALVEYLAANSQHFDPLNDIFDTLDHARIPTMPLDSDDQSSFQDSQDACLALLHLTVILAALIAAPNAKGSKEYADRCHRSLVEGWASYVLWVQYLVGNLRWFENPRAVITTCSNILTAVISNAEGNTYQESIATQPGTADLVFLFLCQRGLDTNSRGYFTDLTSEQGCSMVELLCACFTSRIGWGAVTERLASVNRQRRREIVTSILGRISQTARIADGCSDDLLVYAIQDIHYIVASILRFFDYTSLSKAFRREGFISVTLRALSDLCDKAQKAKKLEEVFWHHLSGSIFSLASSATQMRIPHTAGHIGKMIESGLLKRSFQCLPHVGPASATGEPGVHEVLRQLLPYMMLSEIRDIVTINGDLRIFAGPMPASVSAKFVWKQYQMIARVNEFAYEMRKGVRVNMCANRKHQFYKNAAPAHEVDAMKVCARCHNVVYCSESCQKVDWTDFHSQECTFLINRYKERKKFKAWPSIMHRLEQVGYLEALANYFLPQPDQLKQASPGIPPSEDPQVRTEVGSLSCQNQSSIALFDYSTQGQLASNPQFPLPDYLRATWGDPHHLCLTRRLQQHVDDMESHEDIILAGSIAQYDFTQWIYTLVTLRYSAGASKHRRYAVINTVSTVGEIPIQCRDPARGTEARRKI
ncbi:hypothetical protein NMY22_g16589 [Coprinellus aureogranulatus]|nr:hypothetical protein NMY22_g16589 [Coprinellus aureogranulatus]